MFWLELIKRLPAKWMPGVLIFIWVTFWGVGLKLGFHQRFMLMFAIIATIIVVVIWSVLILMTAKRVKKDIENKRLLELSRSEIGKYRKLEEKLLYAIKAIRDSKIGREAHKKDARYVLPWFLMIGPRDSGKTSLVLKSGMEFILKDPSASQVVPGPTKDCNFFFANQAIVMDASGRYVDQPDKSLDEIEWLNFLNHIKRYRKDKPIDGLILCVDISLLLKSNDDDVERQAESIRNRIDNVVKGLGISFPVYLIFTKCDMVSGFREFFFDLTNEQREQVFGFSLSEDQMTDLKTSLGNEWNNLCDYLESMVLTKLDPSVDVRDRTNIYLFPKQLRLAFSKINLFVTTLFSPSAYFDRPSLHGLYLTSALQEAIPINLLAQIFQGSYGMTGAESSNLVPESKSYFIKDLMSKLIFASKDMVGLTDRERRKILRSWLIPLVAEFVILATALVGIDISYEGNVRLLRRSIDLAQDVKVVSVGSPEAKARIDAIEDHIKKLRSFHIFPWRGERHKVARALEAEFFINVSIKTRKVEKSDEKPKPLANVLVYEESMKDKAVKTNREGEARLLAFKGLGLNQFRIRFEISESSWGIGQVTLETEQGKSKQELLEPVVSISADQSPRSIEVTFVKLRTLTTKVVDEQKAPIPGVAVYVSDASSSAQLAQGFSDATGTVRLEFKAKDGSLVNVFYSESGISYPSSEQLRIDPDKYEYIVEKALQSKPPVFELTVESPKDNLVTKEPMVKVKGKITAVTGKPSMEGVFVKIGDFTAPVAAGGFAFDFPLQDGKNVIPITVANANQSLSQTMLRTVIKSLTASGGPGAQGHGVQAEGTPIRLEIQPPSISLRLGEQHLFTASSYDASNRPVSSAKYSWSVIGEIGQIDPTSGLFTAKKPGSGQVVVSLGNMMATAQVIVSESQVTTTLAERKAKPEVTPVMPQVARIEVNPPIAHVKPGEQKIFNATAYDPSNKPIPNVQFVWSLSGDIGQIDRASGTFIARKPGSGRITVAAEGKTGSAQVTVAEPTWRIISNTNKEFKDISFIDERTGWVVGYPMIISRTNDGGLTWQTQIDGSSGVIRLADGTSFGADKLRSALKSVCLITSGDKPMGWAVGEKGIILHSPDGESWVNQVSFVDVTLNAVHFVNPMNGWIVGRNGTILRTSDGGKKWIKLRSFDERITYNGVFFIDSNKGWIVGQGGTILSSNDGGNTWSVQTTPSKKEFLQDVFFISPNRGWIVGTEGLIMSTNNGGHTWSSQVSKTLNNLFGVRFINDNEGWIVGENGIILKTSDGGKTWSQNQVGNQIFLGISTISSGIGWAVGSKGAIASLAP